MFSSIWIGRKVAIYCDTSTITALFKTIGRPFKNTRTGGLQILPILEARLRIRLR